MTPAEYLKNKLADLAARFPSITVKYAYDSMIGFHIVELSPVDQYYSNSALDDYWFPISVEFSKFFPDEFVTFISSDSSLKVEEPELTYNSK